MSIHSVFDIDLLNLLHNFTLIPIGRRQNANDGLTENSDFLPNLVVLRWHSPAQAHPVMLYIAYNAQLPFLLEYPCFFVSVPNVWYILVHFFGPLTVDWCRR